MGFADSKNKYNPETEGYGNPREWKRAFRQRMSPDEATAILNEDDPWTILGLRKGASKADIKKAYRKMAIKWHPDKNPDNLEYATAMMQKVNAAYAILY